MEFALAIRHIWRHKIWLVPIAIVAVAAILATTYRVSLSPLGLESKSLAYGSASGQVLLQPSRPAALAAITASSIVSPEQTAFYAALLESQPVRQRIGAKADLPWQAIAVQGQSGVVDNVGPNASQRSAQLITEGKDLALFFNLNEAEAPIIDLYAQAPTAELARRIVVSAIGSLQGYVGELQKQNATPASQRVELLSIGQPQAGMLATGANLAVGLLVGLVVLGAGCLLIVLLPRFVIALKEASAAEYGRETTGPAPLPHERAEVNGSNRELNPPQQHLPDGN